MVRVYPSGQSTSNNATGEILLTFDQNAKTIGIDNILVTVNGEIKKKQYSDVKDLYTVKLNQNDIVNITILVNVSQFIQLNIERDDYTTDDEGNNGIVNNIIYNNYIESGTSLSYTFTAVTTNNAYHFHYHISAFGITSTFDVYRKCVDNTYWSILFNPLHETNGLIDGLYCGSKLASNIDSSELISNYSPFFPMSTFVNDVSCTPCLITPTPTPTPTNTPTSTPTNTPTPTPTSTPTPTPVPLTGYTNGFYILVNDRSDSYPGTGTTWFSLATGTTYNGTLNNGPVWSGGTPGYFIFDGTNDWVDFGLASSGSTTGSFTWGGWVKTTTSATQKVFMMRGNDASGSGWSLFLSKENNNKFMSGVVTTSAPNIALTSAISTTTMSNDTWYYLVGVWSAGSSINIYVNGVLETTTATTRTNLRTSGIGWNLMRGNGSDYTNGSLSEFIVYPSVVSGANILNNFNANKSKYGY